MAGGVGEAGGTLAVAVLLFLTPAGIPDFWLTLVALIGLMAMQVVYWLFTHPVNRFWVEGHELGGLGTRFFSVGARGSSGGAGSKDWTALRDRWERSHVARAACVSESFLAMVLAVA